MTDAPDRLTPAAPDDLADALAFALRFDGRKRKHNASEMMARILAERLVEHLERSGFVVMKRPPIGGASALGVPPAWGAGCSQVLAGQAARDFRARPWREAIRFSPSTGCASTSLPARSRSQLADSWAIRSLGYLGNSLADSQI
jgi:hypothetical protein